MATSPDVRGYVDLTLFDRDAQAIFDAALTDALYKLPGWVPLEGNTEVVLLEALALEVSELVFAVNRIPGAVAEVLLRLFGLTLDLGVVATATVTFNLSDLLGHEVPAATRLRLAVGGGETRDLTTTVGLVVPPGSSSGTVAASFVLAGTRPHGQAAGAVLTVLDSLAFVDSAVLATTPVNGRDAETSQGFLDRGVSHLSRLVTTLVLPTHFTDAALTYTYVFRATALDNYDPGQAGAVGTHPGHVTVAVSGPNGGIVSEANKTLLLAELEAAALVNLAVHPVDPTVTAVAVTTTVKALPGFLAATVQANVTAVLDAFLNPDTWPWSGTVRYNELIARIDSAAGVDYVASLTAPAADVVLAGVAPLADLGTVTVTVT